MCVCLYLLRARPHNYAPVNVCVYVRVYLSFCMRVCVGMRSRLRVRVCVHIFTYICFCISITLQHTATHYNTLQHLQCVAMCNTLQHTAMHCSGGAIGRATYASNSQQIPASCTFCSTLQHTATHCNTLQHTASHWNALQHTTQVALVDEQLTHPLALDELQMIECATKAQVLLCVLLPYSSNRYVCVPPIFI